MHAMDMDLRQFMETELYDSILVCDISRQCARGLHHVHELETLHADMKPENIGISIERRRLGTIGRIRIHVRLLDFGSAKLLVDLTSGVEIRSTLHYQSPEKRLGMFHLPGDIYELGVVYEEIISKSSDAVTSNHLYGRLVSDMLQDEFKLRPTTQQLLLRLDDPNPALWARLREVSSNEGMDMADLIVCADPLTFLSLDLYSRMEYIIGLAIGDSLQKIEEAFFLLFKTAQSEVFEYGDGTAFLGQSVLQHIHHFHATVDTDWCTKLFYCMAVSTLVALPYFKLTDVMKLKLWAFSVDSTCRDHVQNTLRKCMTAELFDWCSALQWGVGQTDFLSFIDNQQIETLP
jgi:serine/threonine protein kinase